MKPYTPRYFFLCRVSRHAVFAPMYRVGLFASLLEMSLASCEIALVLPDHQNSVVSFPLPLLLQLFVHWVIWTLSSILLFTFLLSTKSSRLCRHWQRARSIGDYVVGEVRRKICYFAPEFTFPGGKARLETCALFSSSILIGCVCHYCWSPKLVPF